jgi:flavin reductase (DIM6/NTAB) family NADH-FMN oxidoreductase RutF
MDTEEQFNALMSGLDYPMLIVTATDGTRRAGCLVGFAAQCGISPSRFMVWLSKNNHTFTVAQRTDVLAVHVPPANATELAVLFGSRTGFEVDKFTKCAWHEGPGGLPLLVESPRWFTGRIVSRHDTGDHVGLLLAPSAVGATTAEGQLGFQDVSDLPAGREA